MMKVYYIVNVFYRTMYKDKQIRVPVAKRRSTFIGVKKNNHAINQDLKHIKIIGYVIKLTSYEIGT